MNKQFHSQVYIQKKTKTLIQKDTCTPMFTAALFTIAKIWNEWIKKMWCVYVCVYIYIHTHTHTHTR